VLQPQPKATITHSPILSLSHTFMRALRQLQLPIVAVAFANFIVPLHSFAIGTFFRRSTCQTRQHQQHKRQHHHRLAPLQSGRGFAPTYNWTEEAFELEVTVLVPAHARAKDFAFRATTNSIQLYYKKNDTILLDPARKLRGRVNVDGTYWVISDSTNNAKDDKENACRQVTVTIEKLIATPKDDFEVVDYDWKGVYVNDTEVIQRTYDKPEELDVREYAAKMGVDIDNINVSMVDKTMFNSGLNLTRSSLDELTKKGYVQEVTQQADGSEYVVNAQGETEQIQKPTQRIPFLDTDSPWHKANATPPDATVVQQTRNFTRAAFANDAAVAAAAVETSKDTDATLVDGPKAATAAVASSADPIDALTVKRLKEILKSQGLSTTGNKDELQRRLRSQVNALLQTRYPNDPKK
jgi:hypothetical protein